MNCTHVAARPDELEVENHEPPCNSKNDRVHCPDKRQPCDPSGILTPRVVTDKQTISNSESVSRSQGMGLFVRMPDELLHSIFEQLNLRSLSNISMTSSNMSKAVLTYLQSARGLKHVMPIISAGHITGIDPPLRGVGKQHNHYVTCCCNYFYNYF